MIIFGSYLALRRLSRNTLPSGQTIFVGGRPLKLPVDPVIRFIVLSGSLVVSLISGAAMTSEWPAFALYWHAESAAGAFADPVFGKPLNFYLFTLPVLQLVSGWLLVLAVIACGVAVMFIVVASGERAIAGRRGTYIPLPWRGLSIASSLLLLIVALRVYLARFDYLFEDHTISPA